MNVVSHIHNRLTHSSVKDKSPFEAYFRHKLDVSNFKVFGSIAFDRISLDKRKYLEPKSIECFFIGYTK